MVLMETDFLMHLPGGCWIVFLYTRLHLLSVIGRYPATLFLF